MAKRFTDSEKWKKPFFKGLSTEYKLLWSYILDDCEHTGIWYADLDIAEYRTGCKFIESDVLAVFGNRVIVVDKGKWFIPDFVTFQYGEQLVLNNRMHKPIIDKLNKLGLLEHVNVDVVTDGTTANAIRSRVTQKVKDRIYLRDQFTCQYCSEQFSKERLVVDHVLAIKNGGDSDDGNLVSCCIRCNSHKTDLLLSDFFSRNHVFLNPTERVKLFLDGAYKKLEGPIQGPKEKEQIQEQEKEQDGGAGGEIRNTNMPPTPLAKPGTWNTKPKPADVPDLPQPNIQAAIENIYHTKNIIVTPEKVKALFRSFLVVNTNGIKFYNNAEEVYSHFHNTLKYEKFENLKDSTKNNGNSPLGNKPIIDA